MLLETGKRSEEVLDIEWLQLVLMARQLGVTPDEVRRFLQHEHKRAGSSPTSNTDSKMDSLQEVSVTKTSE